MDALAGGRSRKAQLLSQKFGQLVILPNTQEDIHLGDLLFQFLPVSLNQAACGHQHPADACLLVLRHFQNTVDAFFFGRVNKTAGIDDEHLRLGGIFRKSVACRSQKPQHTLRIHLILGAAKTDNTDLHTVLSLRGHPLL